MITSINPTYSGAFFRVIGWGGSFRRVDGRLTLKRVIPVPASTLLKSPFGCLAVVEVGLVQNRVVRQVHHPRGTSNFYLVALVGWLRGGRRRCG